jgi:hypothetical protein
MWRLFAACRFDAIHLDSITKLPVEDKKRVCLCACAKIAPKKHQRDADQGKVANVFLLVV